MAFFSLIPEVFCVITLVWLVTASDFRPAT
jgi:hypothetical protein